MDKRFIAVVGFTIANLLATKAQAQHWLTDRLNTQGRSQLRAGSFEFHPGLGLEVGYDSNTLARPANSMMFPIAPSVRLRISPSITVNTVDPEPAQNAASSNTATNPGNSGPVASFQAGVGVIYHHFFPVTAPDEVSRLSNVGVTANARVHVYPGRTFQFIVSDDFGRVVQGGPEIGLSLVSYNRIQNTANAEFIISLNRGVLDFRVGYTNHLGIFENSQFQIYNFMRHEISLRSQWRFFPKTALMWDATIIPSTYLNTSGAATGLFTSFPIRARLGVNGLLTERLALMLLVGYAGTFSERGDNADTFVGQAEVKYIFSRSTQFLGGFLRDVSPAFLGGYVIRNRFYASINQALLNERLYLSAEIGATILQNGFISTPAGTVSPVYTSSSMGFLGVDANGRFNSVRIDGNVFAEYRFTSWLGVNATLNLSTNITDVVARVDATVMQPLQWLKFEGYLGVRVMF